MKYGPDGDGEIIMQERTYENEMTLKDRDMMCEMAQLCSNRDDDSSRPLCRNELMSKEYGVRRSDQRKR